MHFKITYLAVLTSILLAGHSFAQSGSRVPDAPAPIVQDAAPIVQDVAPGQQGSASRMPLEAGSVQAPMAMDSVISSSPMVVDPNTSMNAGCSGCGTIAPVTNYSSAPMASGCNGCGNSYASDLWYGNAGYNYCSGNGVSSSCGSAGFTRRVYRPTWLGRRSSCYNW